MGTILKVAGIFGKVLAPKEEQRTGIRMQGFNPIAKNSKKGVLLCFISLLLLGGCSGGESNLEKVSKLLTASETARNKGDIETAIPSIKMACELATTATGDDSQVRDLKKKTYEEAIKVADSLNGLGHVKPVKDVLKSAVQLQKDCGISPSDTQSASQRISKLDQAELHESEIFENAAISQSSMVNESDSNYEARRKSMDKVYQLIDKGQYETAEKLTREFMKSRTKLVDYTNDQGYREALNALNRIYNAQQRFDEIVKLYREDAAIQKRGYSQADLEQADPGAFFKAKFYALDLIELSNAQNRMGSFDEALRNSESAERLLRKFGKQAEVLPCLSSKAFSLESQGKYAEGLRCRKEILQILKSTENPANIYFDCLQRIANDNENSDNLPDAVKAYESIYDVLKEHPLKIELAPTYMVEGAIISQRAKDPRHMAIFLERAKDFAQQKRPPHAMGSYYMTLGYFHREGERYDEAIRAFKTAIPYFEKSEFADWRANTNNALSAIAIAYNQQERYTDAISVMQEFLKKDIPRSPEQKKHHLENMVSLADMTRQAGMVAKSHERFVEAIAYMEGLPSLAAEAPTIYLSAAYQAKRFEIYSKSKCTGSECESEQLVKKAIDATQRLNPTPPAMALIKYRIGVMYHELDRFPTAIEYFKESAALWEKSKDIPHCSWRQNESDCLRYLGVAEWRESNDPNKGKERFAKALQLLEHSKERSKPTYLWNLLAMSTADDKLFERTHDTKLLEEADACCREGLELIRNEPDYKFETSVALIERAKVNIKLKKMNEAQKYLLESANIAKSDKRTGLTQQGATTRALQAHIALKQHDTDKAHALLKDGIAQITKQAGRKPPPDCTIAIVALARVCRKAGMTVESTNLQRLLRTHLGGRQIDDEVRKQRIADGADSAEF